MRHPNGIYLNGSELRHRGLYELAARKLIVGVWDETVAGFLGKYDEYLEYEYLWTETAGTASAVRLIEMLPESIELRSHEPTTCELHGREVVFRKRDDGTPFGDYYHTDDGAPLSEEDWPRAHVYLPMYEYLAARTDYPRV